MAGPYTTTLSTTPDVLVATGTDFASAAPITSVDTIVSAPVAGAGILLPTDAMDPTWYADQSGVNTEQITLQSQGSYDCNVYLPDGSVRTVLKAGSSIRLEPGGSNTWAEIKLWG